jgi:hypothetical protein
MQEVISHARAASAPIAGDAMAGALEAGELLDIEMEQLAGTI